MRNKSRRPSYLEQCILNEVLDVHTGPIHTYPRTSSEGLMYGQIVDLPRKETSQLPQPVNPLQYIGILKDSLILTLSLPSSVKNIIGCHELLPEVEWLTDVNVACRKCLSFYIPTRYWTILNFARLNYHLNGYYFTLPIESRLRTWTINKDETSFHNMIALLLNPGRLYPPDYQQHTEPAKKGKEAYET